MLKLTIEEHFKNDFPLNKAEFTLLEPTKAVSITLGHPVDPYFFPHLLDRFLLQCNQSW